MLELIKKVLNIEFKMVFVKFRYGEYLNLQQK